MLSMLSGSVVIARSLRSTNVTDCAPAPTVADLPSYVIVDDTAVRFGVKNTGRTSTLTLTPCHARPVCGLIAVLPAVIVPMTTSGFANVKLVVPEATVVPDAVTARALIVQAPFL